MTTATLAGHDTTWARIEIPAFGIWYADVELSEPEDLTGSVELVMADLTMNGTILSGGPANDKARYRVVGGAGGWGQVIDGKVTRINVSAKAISRGLVTKPLKRDYDPEADKE